MKKVLQLSVSGGSHAAGLVAWVCVLLLAGCGRKATDEVDFGTFKNSVYENKYFGFELRVPSDWNVQGQQERERLAEAGKQVMAGDDRKLKAVMKASEMQSIILLTAFQYPVGTPVDFNPNVVCVAEQIRHLPGIKRGKDYHFHAKKLLEASQVKFEFPKEISSEQLGGSTFDVMYASMGIGTTTVQQKYYATILNGYALCFILSFNTSEQESALQNILASLSFR